MFVDLPAELWLSVLSYIPPNVLQQTTLSLTRALPRSSISQRPLFEHVVITEAIQILQLFLRLKNSGNRKDELKWVRTFVMKVWDVDANVLINLLDVLPCLEELHLRIGPAFTPEHVQELLKKPKPSLRVLNIRLRPYLKSAHYYQFLKGSYYEPFLDTLSSWPSKLTSLSIQQDPLPPSGPAKFAQPIVFFTLTPFTTLSLSPLARQITHLRLRVPNRPITSCFKGAAEDYFPRVEWLDLGGSVVRGVDVGGLLGRIGRGGVKHLLCDGTGLGGTGVLVGGEWMMLGRTLANYGVEWARQREKVVKRVVEEMIARRGNGDDAGNEENVGGQDENEPRRPRRGRRGLATATISIRSGPLASASTSTSPTLSPSFDFSPTSTTPPKIRILPCLPSVQSLCVPSPPPAIPTPTTEGIGEEARRHARADFESGFHQGLHTVRSVWERIKISKLAHPSTRVFGRSTLPAEETDEGVEGEGDVMKGLVEFGSADKASAVYDEKWDALTRVSGAPVLCFEGARITVGEDGGNVSGSGGGGGSDCGEWGGGDWKGHPEDCGHRCGESVWKDGL